MKAIILAAGFGTRLYPLTTNLPKALIQINNKPIIEYTIGKLDKIKEIDKIYILSNNKFYMDFLEWFRTSKTDLSKIKIINNGINLESEQKGAVNDFKYCLDIVDNEDILLLASDNLFEFDLQELINLSNKMDSSTAVLRIENNKELIKKYNHILLDNQNKIIFYEEKPQEPKSNIYSTACYFLKQADLEKIKNHNFDKTDNFGEILTLLHKESSVYGKIFQEFWIDIGSLQELEKAKEYFASRKIFP